MTPQTSTGPAHRLRPLPEAPARGRLLVADAVLRHTGRALRSSQGVDGSHEGLVLWLGRESDDDTLVLSLVVPDAEHTWGSVRIGRAAVGRAARSARRVGLVIAAQVHSHPGTDTRHSDGDDEMVLLPHESMFSLVVARYGRGPVHPARGAGLHQYQDGRWVLITDPSTAMIAVPAFAE